ncbi:hypothetical protein PR048_011876 [Dryococelus australis]|uniref:Reverse transcriptase/retrotransposon-derived protein RNase H-like domain-containing protein n=1 Tax=Dryococelus australis TaxID=614101 RepID=A0ABQ9HMW2_9NEOP|nr:hypothetical protein PR048_011876 [Dryococelus australis]
MMKGSNKVVRTITSWDCSILVNEADIGTTRQDTSRLAVLQGLHKEEFDILELLKIISTVEEPTLWASSVTIVEKPIKRSRFPMPDFETVKYATSAFWNITLDHDSSLAYTFNTSFSRYRWCRLPMGINVACEIYQHNLKCLITNWPDLTYFNIKEQITLSLDASKDALGALLL